MLKFLKDFELVFDLKKATVIIAFFTVLAKLAGLYRDRLLAAQIGPGPVLDMYTASFRIPDFVFNLLILGTLSAAFIPVFSEYLVKDKLFAWRITSTILKLSFVVMAIILGGIAFYARVFVHALVPGFDGEQFELTVQLTRLMLFSPLIFTLSNVFGGVLQGMKQFLITSIAPLLYNLGIIFGIVFLYPRFGVFGLGYGVIIGALLHALLHVPALVGAGYRYAESLPIDHPAIRKILKLYIPRIIGLDIGQVSLLVGTFFGSFLASGSISILNLAYNLQTVPLGIIGVSTAVAVFPVLSEAHAKKDDRAFAEILQKSMVQILFIIIPVSILTLILRAFIVRIIYGAGEFNWSDTINTFTMLGIFSFSMFSQSLAPLLVRAFYARHNTIIPVVLNIAAIAFTIFLSYFFVGRYGIFGTALAFTASSIGGTVLLFILIRRFIDAKVLLLFDREIVHVSAKILTASILAGSAAYVSLYVIAPLVDTRTGLGILIQAGVSVVAAGVVYLVSAKMFRIQEVDVYVGVGRRLIRRLRA